MDITLKTPIEHDGKTVTALSLREADLGDMIEMESVKGGELVQFATLLSRISGLPVEAVRKIKARDLKTIQRDAGPLLGNDPEEAGETSSSS